MKRSVVIAFTLWTALQLHGQGYIVPNGVVYAGLNFLGGYEIDVLHDPTNLFYTGFFLDPQGETQPTVYTNTFRFDGYVDVGVRVFLVSSNQPISLQPILANSYAELMFPNSYVFANGLPFYVALYTGNQSFAPPDGIYSDPLFGWAKLVNNQGVIQLLDSALEYGGAGIYAGTLNIIPVPEPSGLALFGLGAFFLSVLRGRSLFR